MALCTSAHLRQGSGHCTTVTNKPALVRHPSVARYDSAPT